MGSRSVNAKPKQRRSEAARDGDLFYQTQRANTARQVKATSEILALQMDAKGIRVLQTDLREQTRNEAEKRTPRLDQLRSKGEKSHPKRMSRVASVYPIAPFVRVPEDIVRELKPKHEALPARPRPEDKRVWA